MAFDPPSEDNWFYVGRFSTYYAEQYCAGYEAAKKGQAESSNPHTPNNHERDTTFQDECHQWWNTGWCDYNETGPK